MPLTQVPVIKNGVIDKRETQKQAAEHVDRDEDSTPIHVCGKVAYRHCGCYACNTKGCAACMATMQ